MAKLSRNQWLDIRNLWEADPKLSFGALATEYGISRQAITLKAKKEGWKKTGDLSIINRQAQIKANGLSSPNVDKVDSVDEVPCLKGDDIAIDLRVNILCKHRGQIVALDVMQDAAKSLFYEAMEARITAADADDGQKVKMAKNLFWQAKICADVLKDHCAALKIKHGAERTAWGMDTFDLSPNDLESFSEEELDAFCLTGKIPMRFRKIFSGFSDDR